MAQIREIFICYYLKKYEKRLADKIARKANTMINEDDFLA